MVFADLVPLWAEPSVYGPVLALVSIAALAAVGLVWRRRRGATPVDEKASPDPAPSALWGALSRTRAAVRQRLDTLFSTAKPRNELYEELEAILLGADVGIKTVERLLNRIRAEQSDAPEKLRAALREEMIKVLQGSKGVLAPPSQGMWVILVVGVNGSGKTTTIGKLSAQLVKEGKKVLIAAGDTFRAAAIEQLAVWAERSGADIVAHQEGADPAAVAYDALQAAEARGCDVVIIDTAGRLQTAKTLMDQLSKIRRVIDKRLPGAPHETLLVLDGTMGQNALSQAKQFHEATPLTGVVLTKLDGTAKGGMILTLADEFQLPVKLIGVGEKVDDLRPFEVEPFVEAIA